MKKHVRATSRSGQLPRRGSASLDYILVLGVVLPLAALLVTAVPRIVQLVYDMIVVTVGSPLM